MKNNFVKIKLLFEFNKRKIIKKYKIMELYKEAFSKFTKQLDWDLSTMENKSLFEIKELKSIYQTVSEIESNF